MRAQRGLFRGNTMRLTQRIIQAHALLLGSIASSTLMVEAGAARTDNLPQPVGRIVSSGCPEKHLVLKRAHATTTQTDSQIYDGDEVTITDPNCTVEIRIGNELRMLSSKETPYTARKAASTLIPRLLFAMGIGEGATRQGHSQGISQGLTRDGASEEIRLPILQLWSGRIEAGTRQLHIAWRGGQGPFQITLRSATVASPLITQDGVVENYATFDETNLQPGTYQVRVSDSLTRHGEGTFTVVNSSDIPPLPTELQQYQEGNPPRRLLEAGWLATQEGGKFVFEAYQRVVSLALMNPEANHMKERLETGWRPRLPKN